MPKQVTAINFYDSERSRLSAGVTNSGLPFLQMTEIFEAYIGKTPEKGAKVYNNDRQVFFPLSLELITELEMVLEALEVTEESTELSVVTGNGQRAFTFGRDVEDDIWFARAELLSDDDGLSVEHLFTVKDTAAFGPVTLAIPQLKHFLKDAARVVMNLDDYKEDIDGGSSTNTNALGKKPASKLGGSKLGSKLGGSKLGGKTPPPKRPITSDTVAQMLEDDDE